MSLLGHFGHLLKGPQVTANTEAMLPTALADVALIDAKKAAATGSMSVSWWNNEVAEGRAPQPVVRAQRCTRWRAADVAAFWRDFAEQAVNVDAAARLKAQALKASRAAQFKRAAKLAGAAA